MAKGSRGRGESSSALSNGDDHGNAANDVRSPSNLFHTIGDAQHALDLLTSIEATKAEDSTAAPTPVNEYNRAILSHLVATGANHKPEGDFQKTLQDWELQHVHKKGEAAAAATAFDQPRQAGRKRRRNSLILGYNRSLVMHTNGNIKESLQSCHEYLAPLVQSDEQPNSADKLILVSTRLAFLYLENLFRLAVGNPFGIHRATASTYQLSATEVLEWLTTVAATMEQQTPQLKFQVSLYKSRFAFADRQGSAKVADPNIRHARKELKQAMEIFQQKLRPSSTASSFDALSTGGNSSVISGDDTPGTSTNNSVAGSTVHSITLYMSQGNPGSAYTGNSSNLSRVLQGQHQSALNLKANAEQLKGNIKKSLILCTQAQSALQSYDEDGNAKISYYDAIHSNNLALVYQTHAKRHLALHTMSKALHQATAWSTADKGDQTVDSASYALDGTARPDPMVYILYNSALCAARCQRFESAYECMALCLQHSATLAKRPRCWIRLAETCIGIRAKQKRQNLNAPANFSVIQSDDGKIRGLVLRPNHDQVSEDGQSYLPVLGSPDDLKQIQANPLVRAYMALKQALELYETFDTPGDDGDDMVGIVSAHLSASFVCLELRKLHEALEHAQFVLDHGAKDKVEKVAAAQDAVDVNIQQKDAAELNLRQRQLATARMYTAEIYCSLGNSVQAMRHLVGDGKDDAFDRLASELAGVTIDVASKSGSGKSRLALAQAMVRCSASVVSAHLGNAQAAKQLAMSAQAMEDAAFPPASRGQRSMANRSLIYAMLKSGNTAAALTLLRSQR